MGSNLIWLVSLEVEERLKENTITMWGHWDTREEGDYIKTEAEIGIMLPQAKEGLG